MYKRTFAAFLLLVSLFAPTSFANDRGRDDQPQIQERIVRYLHALIPPMYLVKLADDMTVPHP